MERRLVRSITLSQAVALYVGAVVGAGVLILPGAAASMAGPASLLAWGFDSVLGIPLALTFAALAARFPDAGGVSTYTTKAFGPGWGAVVGWFYFVGSCTGQVVVPLTGGYYAAGALGLGAVGTYGVALGILVVAVGSNWLGLQVSGRLQLLLSGGVAAVLLLAVVAAAPRLSAAHFVPFAPHGFGVAGQAGVLIFFAFFGWEAIAQLSAEFKDPARDVPRSTAWSIGVVTVLYVGVALVTVGTGTYGSPAVDRTAVARLLADSLGTGAGVVAAGLALLISLGTANAFVAATSRLGYALARDGALPRALANLSVGGVPTRTVTLVGVWAALGLALSYLLGWGADRVMIVPSTLGLATYIIGTAAGVKLLQGSARWLALSSLVLCLATLPFAGASVLLPLVVGLGALTYRRLASV